jgi:hypothetical protein
MVEEQSFISGLTGYLSGVHADRIERTAKGEQCEIKLVPVVNAASAFAIWV